MSGTATTMDGSPPLAGSVRPSLVVLITHPYPPSSEPGATRLAHFAKYLLRSRYNVKVVTANLQNPPRSEVVYAQDRRRVPDRKSIGGLTEMVLRKFFFTSDESMLWALEAFSAAEPLIRSHPDAVVFSTFPPVNAHLAALFLKRRYGVRWIADFRDPLVGSPGRVPRNRSERLRPLVDRATQNAIFRNADVLIANTDAVLARWRKRHPQWSGKMVHIWNGFDPEEILTALPLPARSHKVMVHTGTIYTGRHPVPLLESMERLISRGRLDPKAILVRLVGSIEWTQVPNRELFRRLQESGCVEVTAQRVSPAEARQSMCEADYLLLLDIVIPGAGQQLPSKIFEYISIGRPILAVTTRNSPVDRVLAGSGIPCSCIYSDSAPDEADRAVMDLLSRSTEPALPSEWYRETFDAAHRTRVLSALIDGMQVPAD